MLRTVIASLLALAVMSAAAAQVSPRVERAWPDMDWSTAVVPVEEILSGGVGRDGIPPVYDPRYESLDAADIPASEPVIGLEIGGEARAFPLRYMTAHEIVDDVIAGVPVAVTYCPLCNTAMVFDRRVDGQTHTFGVSGLLRKSDLIMWDHETESLWQQFEGRAIAGPMAGAVLERLPSRLESFEQFARRHPDGRVLAPPRRGQRYGRNPYVGYDALYREPFLYRGDMPDGVPPMLRVVVVGERAWSLADVAEAGEIIDDGVRLRATHEQNSALDEARISRGRSVAGVVVEQRADGQWRDIPHEVTFAFVFHAFHPDGDWRFARED